ncbi:beta-propeller fold lactonase family protein [Actinomycetaceae bacterium MB13-C1-2]|nr:beta-propeller fold lactonase family protein [Actinomycetaceae bacterium MB13-C1-2]
MDRKQPELFWIGGATGWGGQAAPGVRTLTISGDGGARLSEPLSIGPNPMFAAVLPTGGVVVSHEVSDGFLTLLQADESLRPEALSPPVTKKTGGSDPTSVAIVEFPSGGMAVLSANYSGGSLSVNPLSDKGLAEPSLVVRYRGSGPVSDRQASSHPHQVVVNRGSGEVFVPDLGADVIHVHRIDDLERNRPEHRDIHLPAGSGPRCLVVSNDCALVACELDALVHVITLERGEIVTDASPSIKGDDAIQNFPSAIRLTSGGNVLVGNRGPDTIGVLAWDENAQSLLYRSEFLCGGSHPRDFQLNTAEDVVVVANLKSNDLAVLDLNDDEGTLKLRETIPTGSPSCVVRQVLSNE